ncbi:MAG: hypothetical protein KAT77_01370 [Nanoarchaeota archaeon]|nr:hypothetical protein [Nanoarchaeota archaeon]
MTLPSELKRRVVSSRNRFRRLKEEIRILDVRTKFALDKVRKIEKKKEGMIKDIKKRLSEFDYEKLKDKLLEYQALIEKQELPWTRNLKTVIFNHIANFKKDIGRTDPEKIMRGAANLFIYFDRMQKLLTVRVADLEDEVNIIKKSVKSGIPVLFLFRLNEDEIREKSIDSKFSELASPYKRKLHRMEKKVAKKILNAEAAIVQFEHKHGKIEKIHEAGKHVLELFEKIAPHIEHWELAVFILENGISLLPIPGAVAGAHGLKWISKLLTTSYRGTQTKELKNSIFFINSKLETVTKIPGFDKGFRESLQKTREKYKGMAA